MVREGSEWGTDLAQSMGQFSRSGFKAIEPILETEADIKSLIPYLRQYHISMPSAYVNSTLHDPSLAKESMRQVLALGEILADSGVEILVTNPSPISWGLKQSKSDLQIREQTRNVDKLGSDLQKLGIKLAYHIHDIELLDGAKEFHHMLQHTDPSNVSFCLDTHWVFRGCGDSELALFDVLKMYGNRIIELHLRQSNNGIWSETFGKGDIDYHKFAKTISAMNLHPHLVIEQAVENGSPDTIDMVRAHQISLANVREIFSIL